MDWDQFAPMAPVSITGQKSERGTLEAPTLVTVSFLVTSSFINATSGAFVGPPPNCYSIIR